LGRHRGKVRMAANRVDVAVERATAPLRRADLAIFHAFMRPPWGGGNQFLRALVGELQRRGLRIAVNRVPHGTRACLVNAFNFDERRLRALMRPGVRIVHRVDGPVAVSRGYDDGIDEWIVRFNSDFADATIFQSTFSRDRHRELGYELRAPVVIPNAPDPSIFHALGRRQLLPGAPVRLIATSWSQNPLKGSADLKRLEELLDWSRYELTFVGRSPIAFDRVRTLPPQPSAELAEQLRQHHIYVTAHRNEACSNALLEALSCGCPAAYVRSGSNAEFVGDAGIGYDEAEELPGIIDELARDWHERQGAIAVKPLAEIADRYLEVLGLA